MPTQDLPQRRVSVHHLTVLAVCAFALVIVLRFFRAFEIVGLGFLAISALAAALRPLVRWFPARRWISALFVGLVPTLVLLGLVILLSLALSGPVHRQIDQWPSVQSKLDNALAHWSDRLHLSEPMTIHSAASHIIGNGGPDLASTKTALSTLLTVVLFITFGTLFLVYIPDGTLLDPVTNLLPPRHRRSFRNAVLELQPQLRYWVLGVIVAMLMVGVVSWGGFALIHLEFGTALALLAGASEIVPYIGPAITFIIALTFAATQGWHTVGEVVVLWAVIHILEAYIIWPLIIRKAVEIPPVVTLFSIIFWGEVFGIPGLLLAVPLDLVVWTILKHLAMARDEAGSGLPSQLRPKEISE